jgi:hypothetical protein
MSLIVAWARRSCLEWATKPMPNSGFCSTSHGVNDEMLFIALGTFCSSFTKMLGLSSR